MKCVQNNQGEVRRVSEDRAIDLLTKGWKFAPKSLWKNSPDTTWQKGGIPNPMSEKKAHRKAMKNK